MALALSCAFSGLSAADWKSSRARLPPALVSFPELVLRLQRLERRGLEKLSS